MKKEIIIHLRTYFEIINYKLFKPNLKNNYYYHYYYHFINICLKNNYLELNNFNIILNKNGLINYLFLKEELFKKIFNLELINIEQHNLLTKENDFDFNKEEIINYLKSLLNIKYRLNLNDNIICSLNLNKSINYQFKNNLLNNKIFNLHLQNPIFKKSTFNIKFNNNGKFNEIMQKCLSTVNIKFNNNKLNLINKKINDSIKYNIKSYIINNDKYLNFNYSFNLINFNGLIRNYFKLTIFFNKKLNRITNIKLLFENNNYFERKINKKIINLNFRNLIKLKEFNELIEYFPKFNLIKELIKYSKLINKNIKLIKNFNFFNCYKILKNNNLIINNELIKWKYELHNYEFNSKELIDKELKINKLIKIINYPKKKIIKKEILKNFELINFNYLKIFNFISDENYLIKIIENSKEINNFLILKNQINIIDKFYFKEEDLKLFLKYCFEQKGFNYLIKLINLISNMKSEYECSDLKDILLMFKKIIEKEIIKLPQLNNLYNFHNFISKKHKTIIVEDYEYKYNDEDIKIKNINGYYLELPKTRKELIELAINQNHCVDSYHYNIINNHSLIYILKYNNNIIGTAQIKNKKIIQFRGKSNSLLNKKYFDIFNKLYL